MARLRAAGGAMMTADATTPVDVQAPPAGGRRGKLVDLSSPNTWTWIYFGVSVGWLALVYFGHGGVRGSVL